MRAAGACLAAALLAAPPAAAGPGVPTAPRSVKASPAIGSVEVTWRAPRSAGATRVDRYKVVRWATGVRKRASTVAAKRRSVTITALAPGTSYAFQVFAHNARGWSKASRTVRAVPRRASAPLAPVPTAPVPEPTQNMAPTPTPEPTPAPEPTPMPDPTPAFGTIPGPCGLVAPQLDDATGSLLRNRFDFHDDPYDDPDDRSLLTPGAQTIAGAANAGGSSTNSQVFAFETLARCENASLVKLGTEIVYDTPGEITDLLVQIGGSKVGVNVTRAVGFPFDAPYTQDQANTLLVQKLNDIKESSQNVSAADAWVKQVLVVMAYADMHGDAIEDAWNALDATTKGDTIVYVIVTDGSDQPVYGS